MEGVLVSKAKVAPVFGEEGGVNGCEEGFVQYKYLYDDFLSPDQHKIL